MEIWVEGRGSINVDVIFLMKDLFVLKVIVWGCLVEVMLKGLGSENVSFDLEWLYLVWIGLLIMVCSMYDMVFVKLF